MTSQSAALAPAASSPLRRAIDVTTSPRLKIAKIEYLRQHHCANVRRIAMTVCIAAENAREIANHRIRLRRSAVATAPKASETIESKAA